MWSISDILARFDIYGGWDNVDVYLVARGRYSVELSISGGSEVKIMPVYGSMRCYRFDDDQLNAALDQAAEYAPERARARQYCIIQLPRYEQALAHAIWRANMDRVLYCARLTAIADINWSILRALVQ